jgi:hypothetical protein
MCLEIKRLYFQRQVRPQTPKSKIRTVLFILLFLTFQIVSNKTGLVYSIRTLGILAPDETEIKALYPGQVFQS